MKTPLQITTFAVKTSGDGGYPMARNIAYEMAVKQGYSMDESEEIAWQTYFALKEKP